jgi:exodeoxyribonuclease VII large subunit
VPGLLRNELSNNQTIDFYGYISHRVEKSGKISVQINITELIGQSKNKISEADIKTLEVLQKKAKLGYRDVDSYIKKSIYENKTLDIIIIIGKNAIIDEDIKHQLQE